MPTARPGATVHLLCGLNGAGKTTHARRLEQDTGALRLSLDAFMLDEHPDVPYHDSRYGALAEQAKQALWARALPELAAGRDVVLDWNQWSRARRATWRDHALRAGCALLLHVLDVDVETAVARAGSRAESAEPGSHALAEEHVRQMADLIEWPTDDEGIPILWVSG